MIERGDDDLIAGLPVAADDAAEMESQRGHIHAETMLSGEGAFNKARTDSRAAHHLAGDPAGEVVAAQVGVVFPGSPSFFQHAP